MTNTQKNELIKLIESNNNPYELLAISKTLHILTVAPLDDNEREVYKSYTKKMEKLIGEITEVREEDMQAEADSIIRDEREASEAYDNLTINEGAESESELN